jgi:RNA polymerase sigma-70 factor (ECF subfamily)
MIDSTDQLYERLLVLRCQAGDEAAFAELVERYQPRLRYYVSKLLRDTQCAEDVLQDVWLAAFRAVSRLGDIGAFRAWLYRIARDRSMREFRRRAPPCQHLGEVDLIDEGADEAHFTAEDVERIHAALDELSAEHRDVLVLRYIEDMTYEEIARVVGCQDGTVRSRLHYAKRALRGVLERMNVND